MIRIHPFITLLVLSALLVSACQPIVAPQPETAASAFQTEVFITGAPYRSSNSADFGPDGNLYIASVGGHEILVMDPETGAVLKRLGEEIGVTSPDDLVFGPDGSLYWTNLMSGEVGRLAPDGTVTSQKVAVGLSSITFSADGRLFAALIFYGDALYELDPNLVAPPRLLAENVGFLNGFDFGPDGYLYAPLYLRGQFVRVDVNADPVTIEPFADGFKLPVAVKFDSQGRCYGLDEATGELLLLNIETGERTVIATVPPGVENLAFDAEDRLFLAHNSQGYVFEVLADGAVRTVSPGGMNGPSGIAVINQNGVETIFSANVMALNIFDAKTGEPGPFFYVQGITVAPDGDNMLLTSWLVNLVQIWNPTTHETVAAYRDFAVPINAIRFQGDLIVAELKTGSVLCVNGADPSQRTPLITTMKVPAGLAATDDDLWVGDFATGQVLQLVADGEVLSKPVTVATDLAGPEGLTVTDDGRLLVVESGARRLSAIDLATGEVTTVAEDLAVGAPGWPGWPPIYMLDSVAIDAAGTIYVSGYVDNVIYRITPAQ